MDSPRDSPKLSPSSSLSSSRASSVHADDKFPNATIEKSSCKQREFEKECLLEVTIYMYTDYWPML